MILVKVAFKHCSGINHLEILLAIFITCIILGYPPSGDQPARIHRIKPTPTSTTAEGIKPSEPSVPARLVSTEVSKILQIDDMASSTTPTTPISHIPIHKVQENIDMNSIATDDGCSSSSTNTNPVMTSKTSQSYQHLVGILSTPPIINNTSMAIAAAEAAVTPQEHNILVDNQIKSFKSMQNPELTWNRQQNVCQGNL